MTTSPLTNGSTERNRRQWSRYQIDEEILLTLGAEGRSYACVIQDISLGGVKLRLKEAVASAGAVQMNHPASGTISGQCVWQSSSAMGIVLGFTQRSLDLVFHCINALPNSMEQGAAQQAA